jgi:cytochrome c oxidase subunit IV
MSTIATRRNAAGRPPAVAAAVLITVVLTVVRLPLFLLLPGGEELSGSAAFVGSAIVAGLLAGAWGLWRLHRWGAILTFVMTLLNLLSSLPGFAFADDAWTLALLIATTPPQIAVLVLIALRSSRSAYR